ncbi:unnamed protein product [Lampetra fluviatilis]
MAMARTCRVACHLEAKPWDAATSKTVPLLPPPLRCPGPNPRRTVLWQPLRGRGGGPPRVPATPSSRRCINPRCGGNDSLGVARPPPVPSPGRGPVVLHGGRADPGDQGALRVAALGISPGGSQRAAAAAIPHGGYDNDDGGCAISRRSLHRAPSCAGRPVGRRTARRRRAGGDPDDRALRAPSRREEA